MKNSLKSLYDLLNSTNQIKTAIFRRCQTFLCDQADCEQIVLFLDTPSEVESRFWLSLRDRFSFFFWESACEMTRACRCCTVYDALFEVRRLVYVLPQAYPRCLLCVISEWKALVSLGTCEGRARQISGKLWHQLYNWHRCEASLSQSLPIAHVAYETVMSHPS